MTGPKLSEAVPPTAASPAAGSGPEHSPRARTRPRRRLLQIYMPVGWWVLVLGIPYVLMVAVSFWPNTFRGPTAGFTLEHWERALTVPVYQGALVRSIRIALIVTVLSTVIGYPTAYFIATRVHRRPVLIYVLLQIPLWTSYLIRAYAWRVVLGTDGVIAAGLRAIGISETAPSWLLFSDFAVILVITTMFIPFVTMAVYPVLAAIPSNVREAAKDLQATRMQTFRYVTLPLSRPALISAATYVFAISFGDFIAPTLVGGPHSLLMTQLIFNQIGVAYNWPMAAVLGLVMCLIVLPLVIISQKMDRSDHVILRH